MAMMSVKFLVVIGFLCPGGMDPRFLISDMPESASDPLQNGSFINETYSSLWVTLLRGLVDHCHVRPYNLLIAH